MKSVVNKETGKTEMQFSGKLININEEVRENSKGTKFQLATIEFKDVKGNVVKSTAAIYDKNLQHGMSVGENYLCTASQADDNSVYIHVSHLTNFDRADASAFGFETVAQGVEAGELS